MTDLIDELAGITPGDPELRRPVAREQAQASHDALFAPVGESDFTVPERQLIAAFVTRLTRADATSEHYARVAAEAAPDIAHAVLRAAEANTAAGPYGEYAEEGLRDESIVGPRYAADPAEFGDRLAAALTHAHLLVYRPRETDGAAHDALLAAGWSVNAIVTLSQLVSFLAFQQRVVAGLSAIVRESETQNERVPA